MPAERVVISAEMTEDLPMISLVLLDLGGLESLGCDTMERRKSKGGDFWTF